MDENNNDAVVPAADGAEETTAPAAGEEAPAATDAPAEEATA